MHNLGLSYKYSSEYVQAENTLIEAIAVWEKLRVGLEDRESYRISLFETQNITYQALQQVRVAIQKYPEALEAAEQGRARAFVALLSSKLSRDSLQINPKLREPSVKVQDLQNIARNQNITIVSYSFIKQETIGSNQLALSSGDIYVWVISPKGLITFRKLDVYRWELEHKKLLLSIIEELQRNLSKPNGRIPNPPPTLSPEQLDNIPDELKSLYDLLIKPIEEFLPSDPNAQVVFVPHNALFLIPFAALRDQSGRYLIEKHTISYAPSIQILEYTERLRLAPKGKNFLIVGNPTEDLSQAEQEARDISNLQKTEAIIGKEATKQAILAKIADAQIIHLAAHGTFDSEHGLDSAIALANNKLTATDILQLNLKAKSVVLSACNTAKGKVTSDGVIGLSRAFILAGTPSIVVSLWSVPDAETSQLMVNFYQNMQSSSDRAKALRNAMLATMKSYPHPRNWAAFTLIGSRD
ncbi:MULTISPECIES: CHAT domain-containing protein [Pseudanabaena]|uniref:WD-40 repeat-containing protein n=2 Tax=Pseudanabaena TaxID=1152 RepID=L8N3B1_9CYAN|nr:MULTISPECIES: CHAT domain-containing protein [Pseudanabaena]ELS34166.1 WD-40 repeat-containing protein [Pseudanabaena biceps PCC 7429]MDG3493639.1 CHAT domain-containing protein [Pseudanabaena catenata USMAC16]